LIPVEAVRDANEDKVSTDQSRERVLGAPDCRVDTAPTADYLHDIYYHYGYPPRLASRSRCPRTWEQRPGRRGKRRTDAEPSREAG
jgi:hypothetical protein